MARHRSFPSHVWLYRWRMALPEIKIKLPGRAYYSINCIQQPIFSVICMPPAVRWPVMDARVLKAVIGVVIRRAAPFLRFLRTMKRVLMHIAFWFLYTFQDAVLAFTWIGPLLPRVSSGKLLGIAVEAAMIMLVPKLLLSYFILQVVVKQILNESEKMFLIVTEVVLAFFIALLVYRVLSVYYVIPHVYIGAVKNSHIFSIKNMLADSIDLGFATCLAVSIKFIRIQLSVKEREKQLLKDKLETELKYLRNQTNPHFLFNTLNNIYGLARKKSDDTAEVVMKLSKLLRFMLYESNKPYVKVCDEIKMLDDYIKLEKIRYSDRLSITFNRDIDSGTEQIAPLLLLPFVENAFKHGASENRFRSVIRIDMKVHNGLLDFAIENTRESGDCDKVNDNIGLKNVRRQLELMYREYDLQVLKGTDNFRVMLKVNLRNYAKI